MALSCQKWLSGLAPQQARQLSDIAARLTHEETPERADAVGDAEAQIADGAERRDVVREKPVHRVHGEAHHGGIETPPALVAFQHVDGADIETQPRRVEHDFCQRRRILEPEIETLPCNRMNAMRRIARERETIAHIAARQMESSG